MTAYAAPAADRQNSASPSWLSAWACRRQATKAALDGLPVRRHPGLCALCERRAANGWPRRAQEAMKCCWKCRWSRSISPTAIRARTHCAPAGRRCQHPAAELGESAASPAMPASPIFWASDFCRISDALSPVMTCNWPPRALFLRQWRGQPVGAAHCRLPARHRFRRRAGLRSDTIQTALEIDQQLSAAGNPGPRQWQRRGFGLPLSGHRGAHRRNGRKRPGSAGLCTGPRIRHSEPAQIKARVFCHLGSSARAHVRQARVPRDAPAQVAKSLAPSY